jgi:hypothetical protein
LTRQQLSSWLLLACVLLRPCQLQEKQAMQQQHHAWRG